MAEPTREEVDTMRGPVVLEFGASWCPHCQAIRPAMAAQHPQVRHLRVEDGRGKRLGRSFGVKLWPTLVFLRDGEVLRVAVRPPAQGIERGFAELVGGVARP